MMRIDSSSPKNSSISSTSRRKEKHTDFATSKSDRNDSPRLLTTNPIPPTLLCLCPAPRRSVFPCLQVALSSTFQSVSHTLRMSHDVLLTSWRRWSMSSSLETCRCISRTWVLLFRRSGLVALEILSNFSPLRPPGVDLSPEADPKGS